jgi:hypothetical protein
LSESSEWGDTGSSIQGPPGQNGTNGTNGNTVLNGTGPPSNSLGNDGDFYIDTGADVLYGPKAGGTWPTPGTSLAGPAGAAGTGATVSTAPSADCPNGGEQVTDGNGNTAYACNGANGGAPDGYGTFQHEGSDISVPSESGFAAISTLTVPGGSYIVNATLSVYSEYESNGVIGCYLGTSASFGPPPAYATLTAGDYTDVAVTAGVTAPGGSIVLFCTAGLSNVTVYDSGITATQVGSDTQTES